MGGRDRPRSACPGDPKSKRFSGAATEFGAEPNTQVSPVDAAFPGPKLVPDDPAARYRMREWGRRTDMAAAALSVLGWHMFLGPMGRAMDRQPEAYLMDEPLSNLDAKLRVQMRA